MNFVALRMLHGRPRQVLRPRLLDRVLHVPARKADLDLRGPHVAHRDQITDVTDAEVWVMDPKTEYSATPSR